MNIAVMDKVALVMILLAIPTFLPAQTPDDRAAVERAALNYLEGFYEGSTEKLRQSVHPDAHKFGFYKEDGKYKRSPMSVRRQRLWDRYRSGLRESFCSS